MEEKTLVIEYEDAELEALIIKHKCNDKRYRKLKGANSALNVPSGAFSNVPSVTDSNVPLQMWLL